MIKYRSDKLQYVNRNELILRICDGKNVLHLGCTDSPFHKQRYLKGQLLHQQLIHVCKSLYGVDIDKESLFWMKQVLLKGEYHVGDIEDNTFMDTFANKNIDVVLLPDVLEHLNNPFKALKNIHKVCNYNTKIIVTAPNAFSLKTFMRILIGYEFIHQDHIAFYSPYTLKNILCKAGFTVSEFFTFSGEGRGVLARTANLLIRMKPMTAEGIGLVACMR